MEFRLDKVGFGELLRTSPELRRVMLEAAQDGADKIRPHMPIGKPPDDKHPGQYRELLHAAEGDGAKGDRVGARIVAGAPYSAALEWGDAGTDAEGPLTKAIDILNAG